MVWYTMRRLVTFIVRLWVDSENSPTSYEGKVEYVATGELMHIRSEKDIIHFIREHINPCREAGDLLNCDEYSSGDS